MDLNVIIVLIGCMFSLAANIFYCVKAIDKKDFDVFYIVWGILFACGSWITFLITLFVIWKHYRNKKTQQSE